MNATRAKSGRLLDLDLGWHPPDGDRTTSLLGLHQVGSRLLPSRLNIIGTETKRAVAGLPRYDFAEMDAAIVSTHHGAEADTGTDSSLARWTRATRWSRSVAYRMSWKKRNTPSARLTDTAARHARGSASGIVAHHANILKYDVDAGIEVTTSKPRDPGLLPPG